MAKKPNSRDQKMYREFAERFQLCFACLKPGGLGTLRMLQNAHIVGGPGRRHDRRAIVRLCGRDHLLSHGARLIIGGKVHPTLSRANLLWLKRECDPEYFDLEYLNSLATGTIGEPERPDEYFTFIGSEARQEPTEGSANCF